jgi:hypothetical protein
MDKNVSEAMTIFMVVVLTFVITIVWLKAKGKKKK